MVEQIHASNVDGLLVVSTLESDFPVVGQCASFLLALARMEADRASVVAKQDFKPAVGLAENA